MAQLTVCTLQLIKHFAFTDRPVAIGRYRTDKHSYLISVIYVYQILSLVQRYKTSSSCVYVIAYV